MSIFHELLNSFLHLYYVTMKLLLGTTLTMLITKMSTQIHSYNLRNMNILWFVYVYINKVIQSVEFNLVFIARKMFLSIFLVGT